MTTKPAAPTVAQPAAEQQAPVGGAPDTEAGLMERVEAAEDRWHCGCPPIAHLLDCPIVIIRDLAAAYRASEQRCRGLEADAGRYRWLRHGDNDERVMMVWEKCTRPFDARFDNAWLLRTEKLDAAIDAAINSAKGGRS